MKLYNISIEDYNNQKSYILSESLKGLEKYNAIELMNDHINKYLDNKEGFKDRAIYREPSTGLKSSTFYSYPLGYIVTKSKTGNYYKYTIYNKIVIKGLVYNTFNVVKLFTIQLNEIDILDYSKNIKIRDYEDYEYGYLYDNVIDELNKNIVKKDIVIDELYKNIVKKYNVNE